MPKERAVCPEASERDLQLAAETDDQKEEVRQLVQLNSRRKEKDKIGAMKAL